MTKWEPAFVQFKKIKTCGTMIAKMIMLVGISAASCGPGPIPPPANVETNYIGRVVDNDSQVPVTGAEVTLQIQGVPPIVYTDSVGVYRFSAVISSSVTGQIRVIAEGYQVYIRNITIFPNINAIEDIRLTALPMPRSTFTPLPDRTFVPSPFATSPLPVKTLAERCIFSETWKVHSSDSNMLHSVFTKPDGCYDMGSIGIFTGNTGSLHILDRNKAQPIVSGMETPINNDAVIEFKVFVNSMYIVDVNNGLLFASFAVASVADPLSSKNTARFKLQVDRAEDKPPIVFVLADAGENIGAAVQGQHYGYGNTYSIRLELTGNVMGVYINNIKMNEALVVPVGPKVFYIGYNLPAHAGLDVIVSELKIDGVLK